MERVLCILKPDAVIRELQPAIYSEIVSNNMKVEVVDKCRLLPGDIDFLYGHLRQNVVFDEIKAFMTCGAVEIFFVEGDEALTKLESLVGSTDPAKASRGTIRGKYYSERRVLPQFPNIYQNLIHSSNRERVQAELGYFLKDVKKG